MRLHWGLAGVLATACAPGGGIGDGGTETETETETDGSTGDGSASATQGSATQGSATQGSATQGSNTQGSASADSTGDPSGDPTGDDASSSGDDATAGSDGSCPPGGSGCLCDIGSMCEEGLECVDGVCVDPPDCEQPEGEPNDDEATAVPLDPAACGQEGGTTEAALFGAESDWYIFELEGGQPFCFTNPTAVVTIEEVDVAVCIYAVCPEGGQPNTSCGFGSGQEEAESPDGYLGCCDDDGDAVLDDAVCDFAQTPPASVEVSVTGDTGRECVPYTLEWHY
jgi:hypothetical protein